MKKKRNAQSGETASRLTASGYAMKARPCPDWTTSWMFSTPSCNFNSPILNDIVVRRIYSQTYVQRPPLGPEKVAVWKRGLIKVRFRLVIDEQNWPLLTGGRCSEVVVKAGLTVHQNKYFKLSNTVEEAA